jgi:hypothetical protein
MNDSEFDAAWREFAKHDEETTAPERLRQTVMGAWDSAQQTQQDRVLAWPGNGRRWSLVAMLGAVAAVIAVVGITMREKDRDLGSRRTLAEVSRVTETTAPAVPSRADVFRLIADPAFETESFEIVRLRLPRTSLEAIGVGLIGPEVTSLVDVDVVVGGDGLPRAIQGIRPVLGIQ